MHIYACMLCPMIAVAFHHSLTKDHQRQLHNEENAKQSLINTVHKAFLAPHSTTLCIPFSQECTASTGT